MDDILHGHTQVPVSSISMLKAYGYYISSSIIFRLMSFCIVRHFLPNQSVVCNSVSTIEEQNEKQ